MVINVSLVTLITVHNVLALVFVLNVQKVSNLILMGNSVCNVLRFRDVMFARMKESVENA